MWNLENQKQNPGEKVIAACSLSRKCQVSLCLVEELHLCSLVCFPHSKLTVEKI